MLLVPRVIVHIEDAERSKEIAKARIIANEITAYNTKVTLAGDGSTLIGVGATKVGGNPDPILKSATYYYPEQAMAATDLSRIGRKKEDLPSGKYAKISVDSDGNASVILVDD